MMVKVVTNIFMEVKDRDQGEEACSELQRGLTNVLQSFPTAEVVGTDVSHFEEASEEERRLYSE